MKSDVSVGAGVQHSQSARSWLSNFIVDKHSENVWRRKRPRENHAGGYFRFDLESPSPKTSHGGRASGIRVQIAAGSGAVLSDPEVKAGIDAKRSSAGQSFGLVVGVKCQSVQVANQTLGAKKIELELGISEFCRSEADQIESRRVQAHRDDSPLVQ